MFGPNFRLFSIFKTVISLLAWAYCICQHPEFCSPQVRMGQQHPLKPFGEIHFAIWTNTKSDDWTSGQDGPTASLKLPAPISAAFHPRPLFNSQFSDQHLEKSWFDIFWTYSVLPIATFQITILESTPPKVFDPFGRTLSQPLPIFKAIFLKQQSLTHCLINSPFSNHNFSTRDIPISFWLYWLQHYFLIHCHVLWSQFLEQYSFPPVAQVVCRDFWNLFNMYFSNIHHVGFPHVLLFFFQAWKIWNLYFFFILVHFTIHQIFTKIFSV